MLWQTDFQQSTLFSKSYQMQYVSENRQLGISCTRSVKDDQQILILHIWELLILKKRRLAMQSVS